MSWELGTGKQAIQMANGPALREQISNGFPFAFLPFAI
jgi:hypothetical protein